LRAELHQVVTFATHPFHGNPAFVVTLPGAPEARTMQGVCDLLETKVVATLSSMSGEGFELRFFTPSGEHPGAGHAAMAAAHVAFVARNGAGLAAKEDALMFSLSDGGNRRAGLSKGLITVEWPTMPYEAAGKRDELGRALGARPIETYVAPFGYVAVFREEADIAALDPDMGRLGAMDRSAVIATAPGKASDIVVRVFAPAAGLPEDPVCGTAHRIIVPYWSERIGKRELHSRHLSARGGDLWCRVVGDLVAISGRTVATFTGVMDLSMIKGSKLK
jgi:PhzF family phenazine biosynthesis protein